MDNEVHQLEQILACSFVNNEEKNPNDMFPSNKYDEDGMFSEIIVSNSKSENHTNDKSSTISAGVNGGMHRFLFHASVNAQYSSSIHEFSKKISDASVQIGMRVMKVSIERGGWFDPGIIDISQSYMRIKKNMSASNGLLAKNIIDTFNSNHEVQDSSVLPGFPSAFLIAKDIRIKATNMSYTSNEFDEFRKTVVSGSANLFGIKMTGNVAVENSNKQTDETNNITDISIKIPGPQIIDWFMQLTPKDNSDVYKSLSGSETFTKIINSLKDYKQKMKEMRGSSDNDSSIIEIQ